MNIEQCKNKLNECLIKAIKSKLNWAAIFFQSTTTQEVECRTIYSDEHNEVLMWVENAIETYKKNDIPFAVYVNNSFREAQLGLFNKS